jgi:hypothetical protein
MRGTERTTLDQGSRVGRSNSLPGQLTETCPQRPEGAMDARRTALQFDCDVSGVANEERLQFGGRLV